MSKQTKKNKNENPGEKIVSENRRARHDYDILDSVECGMVLVGSEVKSLRNGSVSLAESYAKIKNREVWLISCDIPEYFEATHFNHRPKRDRKLLLHRREIDRFAKKVLEKGITLVPLKLYFKDGKAKLLLGLCRGKQEHDKREAKKKADVERGLRMYKMKKPTAR
ncbi:MAG: SsrA-binding protein SmpB [Planctomycetia bacterium]|nr:SsrA-binding protein SmpB [Planctomycetia bacterium]